MSFPYDKQPLYAFVRVYLGGSDFDISPDHLVSFTFDRRTVSRAGYVGSSFTLEVYDDTALKIEELLSTGVNIIKFDYGWEGSPDTYLSQDSSRSRTITGSISEYQLSFSSGGASLTMTGISTSVMLNAGTAKNDTYDCSDTRFGGVPSNIVRYIAIEEGWEIESIVPSLPMKSDKGELVTFIRENQTSVDFINSKLLSEVVPANGNNSVGYTFYFTEDNKVVYEPVAGASAPEIAGYYEFNSGRVGNYVLDFTADFKGIVSAVAGAGTLDVSAVDSAKNEMINLSISKSKGYFSPDVDISKFTNVMGISSSDYKELERKALSLWNMYSKHTVNATMTLMGDTTLQVGTYISVLVFTKYGFPHHTSGIYSVTSASDSISGADFTTTVELFKMGSSMDTINSARSASAMLSYRGNMMESVELAYPSGGFYVGGESDDIVSLALSRKGVSEPTGDDEFIRFMNSLDGGNRPMDTAWCAMFVTWCARNSGVPESVVPNYSSVKAGLEWFKKNGVFIPKGDYKPKRGDIFFQTLNGVSHTGIVVESEWYRYRTIEGNVGSPDAVTSYWRTLSDDTLTGFGVPIYSDSRHRGGNDVEQ